MLQQYCCNGTRGAVIYLKRRIEANLDRGTWRPVQLGLGETTTGLRPVQWPVRFTRIHYIVNLGEVSSVFWIMDFGLRPIQWPAMWWILVCILDPWLCGSCSRCSGQSDTCKKNQELEHAEIFPRKCEKSSAPCLLLENGVSQDIFSAFLRVWNVIFCPTSWNCEKMYFWAVKCSQTGEEECNNTFPSRRRNHHFRRSNNLCR